MKMKLEQLLSAVIASMFLVCSSGAQSEGASQGQQVPTEDVDHQNVVEFQYQERGVIMDPIVAAFISKAEQGPPLETLTPHQAWVNLNTLQSGYTIPDDIHVEDRVLKVGPTGETSIKIYTKKGIKEPAPGIVYMHGGGFVMGSAITHARLMCELASCSEMVIVFVEYLNAPEGKYPTAHDQCYAVLEYVAEHPSEFGIQPDNIIVAGDSVGGAMAATCSLKAKEHGGPDIKAQLLFYPAVNLDADAIDYGVLEDGPWLSKANLKWAWSAYFTSKDDLKTPYISPVYASLEQLVGQPRTMVITDDCGPLHKSGETYAKKLISAGVEVTATRYFGITHDFMMLNALKDTPAAKAALAEACNFLRSVSD